MIRPWEKELIVPHALFAAGIERLEQCFDAFRTPDAAKFLPIIGGVATGKSTLMAHFGSLHPGSDGSCPIVVVDPHGSGFRCFNHRRVSP